MGREISSHLLVLSRGYGHPSINTCRNKDSQPLFFVFIPVAQAIHIFRL